jgi:hypothetical protein
MWCGHDIWTDIYPVKTPPVLITRTGGSVEQVGINLFPQVILRRDSMNCVNNSRRNRPRYIYLDPKDYASEPTIALLDADGMIVCDRVEGTKYLNNKSFIRLDMSIIDPAKYPRSSLHTFRLRVTDSTGSSAEVPFIVKWWKTPS